MAPSFTFPLFSAPFIPPSVESTKTVLKLFSAIN